MKTITLQISESVYAELRAAASSRGRFVSELIHEVLNPYRRGQVERRGNLETFQPRSAGAVLGNSALGDLLHDRD